MIEREKFLKALKRLAHKGPIDRKYGICMNVNLYLGELKAGISTGRTYDIIGELAEGWPEHSGEYNYPIPSTNNKIAKANNYYNTRLQNKQNKLWTRKQKLLRNSLINYIIKKMEANNENIEDEVLYRL
jgi:hypothetical protein